MSTQRVALNFTPYEHQRAADALLSLSRFLVLVWHRRAGKTVFAVVELILKALGCDRDSARFGYVAPFLKQAKSAAWDYLKGFAWAIPGAAINEAELSVEFPNGARIRLYGADNPDSLRGGYFDGVVLDEVADMRPQVWGEIIRPMLLDRQGWAIFIGTPKGTNLFSELYHRALKEDGWKADVRRASDTSVLSTEELETARREMSPAQYAQEMECDFSAAVDNVLLRLDEVLEAQRRVMALADFTSAPKTLGVDVARYGDDLTVILPRQGLMAFSPKELRAASTMDVAGQVAFAIDRWRPDATFVDAGGPGAGVVDRLLQLGHDVIPVDFGGGPTEARFENKRAEMWWNMADWVRHGGCLPDIERLAQDLSAPTFTYANRRGRLQLESKDDMRKRGIPSPDYADALATTFAFPVAAKPRYELPLALRKEAPREMDPFSLQTTSLDYDPYREAP